jgi:hypothetical protein
VLASRGEHLSSAKQERVGEGGHDLLDVMGHEDERGCAGARAEPLEEGEKMFAGDGIKAGAGFVENEQARFSP